MGLLRHLAELFREAPSKKLFFRSLALGNKGGDRTVTSADGTTLSVRCTGAGPPLVMVHGTTDGIAAFAFVEPALAEHHQVWVYDRRGRGESGDGDDYSLDREIEDLRAVMATAGPNPHVAGHSFGAVVALAAAARGAEMRSLTIYEPPVRTEHFPHEAADRVRALVDAGDVDAGLRVMIRDIAGVTNHEMQIAESFKPAWKQLLDGARVAPRELDAIRDADWAAEDLPVSGIPVLVIRGERAGSPAYLTVEDLPGFVADPEVVTIAGQGHLAATMAPHQLAPALLDFLARH